MKEDCAIKPNVAFKDAVVLWHMADLNDASGRNIRLTCHGDVKVGVKLRGTEREASVNRGGDGYAAEFQGGYLSASQGSDVRNLKALSLCIRLRDPSGKWNAPLLSKYSGSSKLVYRLFAADLGSGMVLAFELGTDWNERPLQVNIPIAMVGPTDWHDVIVRYTGSKLELFVDGILLDEEWPIGSLRSSSEPCLIGAEPFGDEVKVGFRGVIDHAAIWNRALSDDEIAALSGGREEISSREKEMWGEKGSGARSMQYGRPQGHRIYVGDCIPFSHDGRFHLFYLYDRRHHQSKWGLGAHQWAHASTTDLVHWEHHPLAIPITEEWEGSICTGSVFHYDDTYYAFYATRMPDRTENLSLAISKDGIHFTKAEPNPFASPEPPYRKGPYRDPTVFRDEQTGLFHMLVTAELEGPAVAGRGGCLAHLVSSDLKHWELKEPFIVPGYAGHQPECPDYFFWRGWYYLIFSHHGVAHYRMSRNPLGPWMRPKVDVFDGPQARVLKTAAFTGDRRIGVAFLSEDGYAGCAIFREIVQHGDGTLGTSFPKEMIPPSGEPLQLTFEALTKGASGDGCKVRISALEGFGAAMFGSVPRNIRVSLKVRPEPNSSYFGLCLRGYGRMQKGYELWFEPYRQKVGWRSSDIRSWEENESSAIYDVEGLDRQFLLDIIAKDDIIDVCVDNRRTLVNRVSELEGDRLFFFAQNGQVTFDSIEVRPLL
ncbi:MAG: LamG-like jellyroll fold domain-containing protein [bacterium]